MKKGTSGGSTRGSSILENVMHPYLAYWAAALVTKLPPADLWNRFVRWFLWGEHARRFN
jgi:hypothetical protein